MLTATEVPGIYMQTDTGRVWVFDQVEAEVVRRDPEQLVLRVKNSTTYPASVRVLAESRAAARRPLGWNRLVHAPVWGIAPGEQKLFTVSLSPEGQAESPIR